MAYWNWEGLYTGWSRKQTAQSFSCGKFSTVQSVQNLSHHAKHRPKKLTPGYSSHLVPGLPLFPAAAALWHFK